MSRVVLVTGATGKQGSAVVEALLASPADFRILALTRNPSSKAAQAVAAKSDTITILKGDLENPATIFTDAAVSIWGVFSVQEGVDPNMTPEREMAQGKGLIDAAILNGVLCFVYVTAYRGRDRSASNLVPQFQTKQVVEAYLEERAVGSTMTWTVLRPVVFFENLTPNIVGQTIVGALKIYIKPERVVQYVSTRDMGWFAAHVYSNPDKNNGQAVDLAGDSLTFAQKAKVFEQTTNQPIPLPWGWWFLPWLIFHVVLKDLGVMYQHFSDTPFKVNVESLRQIHPDMMTYAIWLESSLFSEKGP